MAFEVSYPYFSLYLVPQHAMPQSKLFTLFFVFAASVLLTCLRAPVHL